MELVSVVTPFGAMPTSPNLCATAVELGTPATKPCVNVDWLKICNAFQNRLS